MRMLSVANCNVLESQITPSLIRWSPVTARQAEIWLIPVSSRVTDTSLDQINRIR